MPTERARVFREFSRWARQNGRVERRLSARRIAAEAEKSLGRAFPPGYAAFLRKHGGIEGPVGIVFYDLDEAIAEYVQECELVEENAARGADSPSTTHVFARTSSSVRIDSRSAFPAKEAKPSRSRAGDLRDGPRRKALRKAIHAGDATTVARLLGEGPPVPRSVLTQWLHDAIDRNVNSPDCEVLGLLLEAGADPDVKVDMCSAVGVLCTHGECDDAGLDAALEVLLARGATATARDAADAATRGHSRIVSRFIRAGICTAGDLVQPAAHGLDFDLVARGLEDNPEAAGAALRYAVDVMWRYPHKPEDAAQLVQMIALLLAANPAREHIDQARARAQEGYAEDPVRFAPIVASLEPQ